MSFQMPAVVRPVHPYFMHDEMQQQPAALREAIAAGRHAAEQWAELLKDRRFLYLTGCGTSFHAAMTSEYWLRALELNPGARAVEAFELTTGHYPLREDGALIAFSQSGGKGATLAAARQARLSGAGSGVVTGHQESVLAAQADAVLWTRYQSDVSWAHTISYTTSLAAFLSLILEIKGAGGELDQQLERVPDAFEVQLRNERAVRQVARETGRLQRIFVVGSGANFATALEAALKLRETSYAHADGYPAEYFLHGPISSLDSDSLIITVVPPGPARTRTIDVLQAARTIGARSVVVGEIGDIELEGCADYYIEMPPLQEELTPLLYVVPLHLLSYWRAVEAGLNPDLIRRDQESYRKAREGYEL